MEPQSCETSSFADVRKSGYLRKHKSMHRRFFVLRAASERGPARLEYYESEKKFRGKAPAPKRAVVLETCFNINKRADAKNKHMIVLYTRADSFTVAAESEAEQHDWYQAMVELQCKSKAICDVNAGDYGVPSPGPAFKEVWQVKVWPKGLGQAKNLVGIYRLCLTEKTVNFVKLNSDAAAVVLQLMNVRRCGHSENFFFVEVGRSAVTGPGEFWMQVEDSVVAQNMHETLLEAMKALSEEFRQRSKSQSAAAGGGGGATASNPISVPSRRHHPNPPPSQVGFIRRPRTEPPGCAGGCGGGNSNSASPTPRHSFPRGRTSSDGGKVEEGASPGAGSVASSSSPTMNGSCTSTPILRSTSVRAPTPMKTQHSLIRSISNPASPAAQNSDSSNGADYGGLGAGMSGSGGVSGNGGSYSRISLRQPSVSGSLSDYGSSDEYGSSPGEHSLLTPTVQEGSSCSSGGQSLGDEAANYILMAQRGASKSLPTQNSLPPTRRVLRRSSSRESEAERRLMSKRASLPPMALERLAPHRKGGDLEVEEDDYAIMSRSTSRESFTSRQDSETPGGTGYIDVSESKGEAASGVSNDTRGGNGAVDNGYMSMLPGVTASPVILSHSMSVAVSDSDSKTSDDYMAMTPNNSISLPQQIHLPVSGTDGYMMMSPNNSCSPDQRGVPAAWVGGNSSDSRAGSDYMNMSPISARSANSTPPPHEPFTPSDQHSQHPPPKMVYSYYSLPRSYKHNTPAHFDDGSERGKCLGSDGANGDGQCLGNGRVPSQHQDPGVGRHLSLSSSSYSSSSASSESLGEGEEKPLHTTQAVPGARVKDISALHQKWGSGTKKQGQGQRNRPLSLFVDISKANTLPRVRETPLPPEPKSPGEYVSIEFKSERSIKGGASGSKGLKQSGSIPSSSNHSMLRPTSCVASFLPLSHTPSTSILPPTVSEYVNMELGASPSPSSTTFPLTLIGFPSFPTPPTPPAAAPKTWEERRSTPQNEEEAEAEMGNSRRHVTESQSEDAPIVCADYTEMAFGLTSGTKVSSTPPKATLPDRPEPIGSKMGLGLSLDFPLSKGPNPDQGAKVIRADPQGRRRHCSETFLAPSSVSSCPASSSSTTSVFSEHTQAMARRLGLDGVLWGSGTSLDIPAQYANPGLTSLPATQTTSVEQGLNYIDLDLVTKERPPPGVDVQTASQTPAARLFSVLGSGVAGGAGGNGGTNSSASNINTYASIDFYKSEELRSQQGSGNNKDGTEC
ncbi:insulin receptor substrate 1-B-like isoform X2 [Hoplias malabaricus]|uniref:insulin receptor substrate 1-B-like isoform X2 n=1 Tax=Hoplias malabaricus TaxID=27720 RepID=UPI00346191FA